MSTRTLGVDVVVDAAQAERAFARLGAQSAAFGKEIDKTSGHVVGLGKSMLAFGAGIAAFEGLKGTISTVLAAQASIAKLNQAVTDAHASVKALTPVIEAHEAAQRKLGFTDDDTRESMAKLVTAFGATKQAFGEVSVAADLARARNLDLGSATQQLILLQEGNTRAAKALGVVLPDLTKKQWEQKASADGLNISQERGKVLYDELLPRIKNQSAAFANTPAGKIQEFHAQVTHLEEAIDNDLLPVVDKYLGRIDRWLSQADNQKKITNEVKKAVHELGLVVDDAKTAFEKIYPFAKKVFDEFGGAKTVIEGIIALKFGSHILGWVGAFKSLATVLTTTLPAALGSAGLTAAIAAFMANPEVAGFVAVLGGIEVLSKMGGGDSPIAGGRPAMIGTHPLTSGPAGSGYYVGKKVLDYNPKTGKWEEADAATNANSHTISAKQAATILGVSPAMLPGGTPLPGTKGFARSSVMSAAAPFTNVPYQFGGGHGATAGPSFAIGHGRAGLGLDCSGYARAVLANLGISVSGTADTLLSSAKSHPSVVELQPGDLVFYEGIHPNHVMVYIGNGQVIGETHTGASGPEVKSVTYLPITGTGRYTGKAGTSGQGGSTGGGHQGSPYGHGTPNPDAGTGTGGTDGTKKPKKPPFIGEHPATIINAQGSIAAMLRGLPTDLDPIEKSAVAHIKKIQSSLHVHMSAEELAKDRVELAKWGKVLHDEINKNAKKAAAAAAQAKQTFDRALTLDMSHVLRDFDESFQRQMQAFDTETSRHLRDMQTAYARSQAAFDADTQKGLAGFVVAQTPEEKALADFQAQVAAQSHAATVARQQSDLAAAIATGDPVQIKAAQDAINQQLQTDQLQALQDAATASRTAQDAKTTADQQAYQDQRDALKQANQDKETDLEQAYQDQRDLQKQGLQDINDDQRTALQNSLDDWVTAIDAKKAAWADFLKWLKDHGYSTVGLVDPSTGQQTTNTDSGTTFVTAPTITRGAGHMVALAGGGIVTRPTIALIGEAGAEAVVPLDRISGNVSGGDAPNMTLILELDGHRVARATVPYQDSEVRVKLR